MRVGSGVPVLKKARLSDGDEVEDLEGRGDAEEVGVAPCCGDSIGEDEGVR